MDLQTTPQELAKEAHLRYVSDTKPGIKRLKKGNGFYYLDTDGKKILKQEILKRIEVLKIPPAWENVWICDTPTGHIQATGLDEKGRKQYIYHQKWIELSQENKFNKMIHFSEILPYIRERIERDMREKSLTQERILATIVWLLDHTLIRIGNEEYAKENKHYGLTTMRNKHVHIWGSTVTFEFVGKSGKAHKVTATHPKVAKTIKKLVEIPGFELFQYINEYGQHLPIDSQDINGYLKYLSKEYITAKDFRTWGGTVLSAFTLTNLGDYNDNVQMKKNVTEAVCQVSKKLGNTPAVCRSYYIHPTVVQTYQQKVLIPHFKNHPLKPKSIKKLSLEEYATSTLLKKYAST